MKIDLSNVPITYIGSRKKLGQGVHLILSADEAHMLSVTAKKLGITKAHVLRNSLDLLNSLSHLQSGDWLATLEHTKTKKIVKHIIEIP